VWLCASALACAAPLPVAPQDPVPPPIAATVRVCGKFFTYGDTEPSGVSCGLGVVIAPGLVVTAAHVVDGLYLLTVATHDREVCARVVETHRGADVAVLALARGAPTVPQLAASTDWLPRAGDRVGLVGARGLRPGVVVSGAPGGVLVAAVSRVGDSGGAVVDADGVVVGVVSASSVPEGLTIVAPLWGFGVR
jgi:S1-C subfamily serine protease